MEAASGHGTSRTCRVVIGGTAQLWDGLAEFGRSDSARLTDANECGESADSYESDPDNFYLFLLFFLDS